MKIQLVDRNKEMCDAWRKEFAGCDDVVIHEGDFFSLNTDCIVSPANSFGFMDGGLDSLITQRFGKIVQNRVQDYLKDLPLGELLVGEAIIVPTDDPRIPYCISAPTMRVPTILKETANVYLATKAVFLLLKELGGIDIITMSGMGMGVGKVPYWACARQMRQAYDDVWKRKYIFPSSWYDAQTRHQRLYSTTTRDLQFDNETGFEKDIFKVINRYIDAGLEKPDLIKKMEWVTENCRFS